MAGFFVIEEHTCLPRWLAHHIGAYLPVRCREVMLCGEKGRIEAHHDITSERGQEQAVLRLRQAQEEGIVCAVIADHGVRQRIGNRLTYPLCDGTVLLASLRLARIVSETDCTRKRVAFVGADSVLGRAVAVYLAKRVRFFALGGKSETSLRRLADCLRQTEGIAACIGAREDDIVITLEELTAEADCLSEGRRMLPAMIECALFASRPWDKRYYHITARTLAEIAELARAQGISILSKKGASTGQIRLTNEPSANII